VLKPHVCLDGGGQSLRLRHLRGGDQLMGRLGKFDQRPRCASRLGGMGSSSAAMPPQPV
jgi:hypothetical protein